MLGCWRECDPLPSGDARQDGLPKWEDRWKTADHFQANPQLFGTQKLWIDRHIDSLPQRARRSNGGQLVAPGEARASAAPSATSEMSWGDDTRKRSDKPSAPTPPLHDAVEAIASGTRLCRYCRMSTSEESGDTKGSGDPIHDYLAGSPPLRRRSMRC